MSEGTSPARLAVDIGGTFTDLVLEANGRRATVKVLTTQANPERGVLDGVAKVMAEAVKVKSTATLVEPMEGISGVDRPPRRCHSW